MARGKYLSLEEARKGAAKGETIERFCKEHPSEGDEKQFDRVFEKMAKAEPRASKQTKKSKGA